jgi:hypothetical protein
VWPSDFKWPTRAVPMRPEEPLIAIL